MWSFDEPASEEYARLFAALTRIGRPMQQIDIQIAAIAIAQGNTTVLTYDSDLSAVPGLTVENWLTTP
jgi:tRNA(fMet)-specific endonuclease VapC